MAVPRDLVGGDSKSPEGRRPDERAPPEHGIHCHSLNWTLLAPFTSPMDRTKAGQISGIITKHQR